MSVFVLPFVLICCAVGLLYGGRRPCLGRLASAYRCYAEAAAFSAFNVVNDVGDISVTISVAIMMYY